MKRNTLFAVIALALGGIGAIGTVQAQDTDFGSWYIAPRLGAVAPDSNRTTKVSGFGGIGVGVWINPNFALDLEYGINNASFKDNSPRDGHQWENVQVDVAGRWFFGDIGAGWRPYLMGGVGLIKHKAFSGILTDNNFYSASAGWDPGALLGVGLQYGLSDRLAFRGEIAARYDHDDNSLNSGLAQTPGIQNNYTPFARHKGFVDGLLTVGLTYSFGGTPAPAPAAAPPPPPPPPAPVVPAPTKVTIDLRGVEFKFDHPRPGEKLIPSLKAPTAASVQILDEAVDTLKRNGDIRVEVDGHTDSVGSEGYNQALSERRARGVYEYLTAHGVDASRLDGPKGFGKDKPIDTNDTAEGRQRNRRTELNVE